MTLNPVVVAATDPAGTTNWTVTVYDSSGNSKSQNFSVTYSKALSFTLTQTSFPTSTAPYTASIPATGSNFTNLNKVYLVWTGATSGNATWNKTDSDWTSKVSIASDTSMTLNPVVVAATDPAGTTNWTVTVYDSSGNSKSQNFSVTYK
jgi:hypothetical protein